MTRALDMINNTPIRRRCHLRTHHLALSQLSTQQALITPTKRPTYPPNAANLRRAFGSMDPAQRVRQTRAKAPASRQYP